MPNGHPATPQRILIFQKKKNYIADYDAKVLKLSELRWKKEAEKDRWNKAMRSVINL